MKLVISLDYSTFLAIPAEQAGIVVPALSQATYVSKNYNEKTYKPDEARTLDFKFEPDSMFEEAPDAITAIQKSRDESEQKYLKEWTKGQELQKEIVELKKKLEALKTAVSEETF